MDYYKILNLEKEPFSNSPDPDFFFNSTQHKGCLQKLELSIRLKRGLNIVMGEVGTGKTTICRELLRRFSSEKDFLTAIILDPSFDTSIEFLRRVADMLGEHGKYKEDDNEWRLKELIKNSLFHKGVEENRTILLVIDEGQKIPSFCIEIIREFLNYETNEFKLLQVVIFAQKEFEEVLIRHENFVDRINLTISLEPLSLKETISFVRHRIKHSCSSDKPEKLFSFSSFLAIHFITGGYPRKIINLCHQILMALIIQNRTKADWALVNVCAKRNRIGKPTRTIPVFAFVLVLLFVGVGLLTFMRGTQGPLKNIKRVAISLEKKINTNDSSNVLLSSYNSKQSGNIEKDNSAVSEKKAPVQVLKVKDIAIDENILKTETIFPGKSIGRSFPITLGVIKVKNKNTLGDLVAKVYGLYNPKYQNFVLLANPSITNPNMICVGDEIVFPAIPATLREPDNWMIEIANAQTLSEALFKIEAFKKRQISINLFPLWSKHNGLELKLIYKKTFKDKADAEKKIVELKNNSNIKSLLVSNWGVGTIFYSNLY